MVFLVAGGLILVVNIISLIILFRDKTLEVNSKFICVLMLIFTCLMLAALSKTFPPDFCEDSILKEEIELVTLDGSTTKNPIFVSTSIQNLYSYRYETKNNYANGEPYKTSTFKGDSNVMILEIQNCEKAMLRIYKPNDTFWYCNLFSSKQYYVFAVPEGSIHHGIK